MDSRGADLDNASGMKVSTDRLGLPDHATPAAVAQVFTALCNAEPVSQAKILARVIDA